MLEFYTEGLRCTNGGEIKFVDTSRQQASDGTDYGVDISLGLN